MDDGADDLARGVIAMRLLFVVFALLLAAPAARAQVFPPGTFAIDGIPVSCGMVTYVVTPQVPDIGMADGYGQIYLNPYAFANLPTSLKLFWAAHECAHYNVGPDEAAADCWAVRTGRDQGWFPPQTFELMMQMMWNNPGDFTHAPGPMRVQSMMDCYRF